LKFASDAGYSPLPDVAEVSISKKPIMKDVFILIIACSGVGVLCAKAQQPVAPAPKPQLSPENPALRSSQKKSGNAASGESQSNPQEVERLTKAVDKVLNRIQSEESDLYLRINYFEKPDRLNPNSYASKEEVTQWQGILQQLKEKHDFVARLYADVGKDLEAELQNTGANEAVVARFKTFVTGGFPWATIENKKKLIADFIDEQAKLLSFYEKNWGAWSSTSDSSKLEFTSASAANIYKRLRDQILTTSKEIEKEYKEMSE
jgi:hypothetical protein